MSRLADRPLAADTASALYERHRRRIFAYCMSRLGNRQEADDAVQNTFLYAFALLKRGVVPDSELPWLYTIAHNVCRTRRRSLWRRSRVESSVELDAVQAVVGRADSTSDELDGLRAALDGLPTRQRRALLLREWQGLSYAEIGASLALSESAVEALLFRARRNVARKLQHAGERAAVLANGGFLLRLARRLAHSAPATKTATAVVLLGAAAGAGVGPLERGGLQQHAQVSRPADALLTTSTVQHMRSRARPVRPAAAPHRQPLVERAPAEVERGTPARTPSPSAVPAPSAPLPAPSAAIPVGASPHVDAPSLPLPISTTAVPTPAATLALPATPHLPDPSSLLHPPAPVTAVQSQALAALPALPTEGTSSLTGR